jgi:hypothetical protein
MRDHHFDTVLPAVSLIVYDSRDLFERVNIEPDSNVEKSALTEAVKNLCQLTATYAVKTRQDLDYNFHKMETLRAARTERHLPRRSSLASKSGIFDSTTFPDSK